MTWNLKLKGKLQMNSRVSTSVGENNHNVFYPSIYKILSVARKQFDVLFHIKMLGRSVGLSIFPSTKLKVS